MDKQYVVFSFHNIVKEFDTSVILITDKIVDAVNTVQNVEKLGYDLVNAESFAAIAEMIPGKVYAKKDWDALSTSPKVCKYHYWGGRLKLKWDCNEFYEKYTEEVKKKNS